MAEKQLWEEKYEKYKETLEGETVESLQTKWQSKDSEYARQLAQIRDTSSDEYRRLVSERSEAKKEMNTLKENYNTIARNLPLVEKVKEHRDTFQNLLDELQASKSENEARIARRAELGEEAQKLEEELKEIKEMQEHCNIALKNPNATPEQKANAARVLQEYNQKFNENQDKFSKNQLELQAELDKPLKEIPENDIEELKQGIHRDNKMCEMLLEGKTMGEIQSVLNKVPEQEQAKQEQPKQEQPKQEQPKQEQPKQEQPKQEQPKQEQPKQEQPKQEQAKQEQPKQEQPKQEQPKQEQPKQEQPKQEQPKQEQPKPEQAKQEPEEFSLTILKDGVRVNKVVERYNALDIYEQKNFRLIEQDLIDALGKEEADKFINGTEFFYRAMVAMHKKYSTMDIEGNLKVSENFAKRVKQYSELVNNRTTKDDSKVSLTYDLTGTSLLSRMLHKCNLPKEDIEDLRDEAYEARNFADIKCGSLTKMAFKIKDMVEKSQQKRLTAGEERKARKEAKRTKKGEAPEAEQPSVEDKKMSAHEKYVDKLNKKFKPYKGKYEKSKSAPVKEEATKETTDRNEEEQEEVK